MKHTKGNWKVINTHLYFEVSSEEGNICQVSKIIPTANILSDEWDEEMAKCTEQEKANATLLASAPKMLYSLEYTVNQLRETAAKLRGIKKDRHGCAIIDAETLANILQDIANGNQEAINKATNSEG